MPEREPVRRWRLVRAPGAAIPASVRRFNERARARRVAAARPWAIAGLVLAFLGLISWLVFGSSVLGVARVKVVGAGFVGAAEIRDAAAVAGGTPLATLDTGAVAARVRALPAVASARVARDWPRTVVVTVTLRHPVAVVSVGDKHSYVQVDASGVPFRTVATPADLMLIVLGTGGTVDLSDDAVRSALTTAAQVLVSLPAQLRNQVVRIDAPSDTGVELILNGDRQIIWGDSS
ncbi:MAG TPA: FtsQ-type POTRA domain-containing protein, partial [Nakamurella sp.]